MDSGLALLLLQLARIQHNPAGPECVAVCVFACLDTHLQVLLISVSLCGSKSTGIMGNTFLLLILFAY